MMKVMIMLIIFAMLMNDDNVVCKYASDNGNDVVRILVIMIMVVAGS